jgi:hypothetical protein
VHVLATQPLPEGIFDSPSKCTSILFPPEPRAGERQTRAPCFHNMWGKAEAGPVMAALRDEVLQGIEREAKNAEEQARDAARHLVRADPICLCLLIHFALRRLLLGILNPKP